MNNGRSDSKFLNFNTKCNFLDESGGCSKQVQRSRGTQKGWLLVAGGCSSQVQVNVKCLGGSPGWLFLAGGCLSRWLLEQVGLYIEL